MKLGLALLQPLDESSSFLSACELIGEAAYRGADALFFPRNCFDEDPQGKRAELLSSFARKHSMVLGAPFGDDYLLFDPNGASHPLSPGDFFSVRGIRFELDDGNAPKEGAERLLILARNDEEPCLSSPMETYVLIPFREASCYKEKELLCSLPPNVFGLFLKSTH